MQGIKKKLDVLDVRGAVIRNTNIGVITVSFIMLLLLAVSWGVSIEFEGGKLKRRHAGSILAFIIVFCTLVFDIVSLFCAPKKAVFFILQGLVMLSVFLTAVSTGMASIVVDICAAGEPVANGVHCAAHALEFAAGFLLIAALAVIFAVSQQRLVTLEEAGVLQGFGTQVKG